MEYRPNLPPFGPNQGLGRDELLDIILYGTPKSWQKEMERQGFDPLEKMTNEVIEFMEQIEETEDFESDPKPKQNDSVKKNKSKNNEQKSQKEGHCCLFHGQNNTHSTNDCIKMKEQAKRLRTDGAGNSNKKDYSSKSKNKTLSLIHI